MLTLVFWRYVTEGALVVDRLVDEFTRPVLGRLVDFRLSLEGLMGEDVTRLRALETFDRLEKALRGALSNSRFALVSAASGVGNVDDGAIFWRGRVHGLESALTHLRFARRSFELDSGAR